jgi:hypothetical protein
MEIGQHLNEAEIAEFVLDPTRGLGTHLEICNACLNEVAQLREGVTALRTAAVEPEAFWRTQQAQIRAKLSGAVPQRSVPRLAWVALAAVVALAGALVSGGASAPEPRVAVDQDHELLLEVERIMQSDGPAALQPASYLVREISQETQSQRSAGVRPKEINHEN